MKSWIIPTFGAFLFWGLWSFIPKITTKYIDPKSAVIYEVMGGIIIAVIVLFFLNFRVDVHPKNEFFK